MVTRPLRTTKNAKNHKGIAMKAFTATVVAALFSFPAFAQEGDKKSQACEELGNAALSAALVAHEVRAAWQGSSSRGYHDARAAAQGLAGDELDILYNREEDEFVAAMNYEVVSDMVDAIVIDMYQMPRSAFTGEPIEVLTAGLQIADRTRTVARAQCMRGYFDLEF